MELKDKVHPSSKIINFIQKKQRIYSYDQPNLSLYEVFTCVEFCCSISKCFLFCTVQMNLSQYVALVFLHNKYDYRSDQSTTYTIDNEMINSSRILNVIIKRPQACRKLKLRHVNIKQFLFHRIRKCIVFIGMTVMAM